MNDLMLFLAVALATAAIVAGAIQLACRAAARKEDQP